MSESGNPEERAVITGLARGLDDHLVWTADSGRLAPGWRLTQVDLGLKDGRPFGHMHFTFRETGQQVGIGVRWDHVYDQLHCFLYEGACDDAVRKALERDARHRAGTFMAIYAELGALVAAGPIPQSEILAASHLVPDVEG